MTIRRTSRRRVAAAVAAGLAATSIGLGIAAGTGHAVVGGTDAADTSNPWQVSLQDAEGHLCGGTIVDASTVVTAAHCTEGYRAGELRVLAGVTDLTDRGGQTVSVARIVDHPAYGATGTSDIALLILAQPLDLGGRAEAIGLATGDDLGDATTGRTSGWGALSENGDGTDLLQEADVPLVDDASCDAQLGIDARTETCAGGTGTDSCYGDSGGPLIVQGADGEPKLAGVVSWGEVCGGSSPGVYTEVPAFAEWIAAGGNGATGQTAPTPPDPVDPPAGSTGDGAADDQYDGADDVAGDEWFDDESWDDGYWDDEYADDGYWDDQFGDDEYWDDEYWDVEFGDDEYWDDEYWDVEFGDDGWGDEYGAEYGDEYWDDDGWDDEYADDGYYDDGWGDEYADDGYWDDDGWDDEYGGDGYWDDEYDGDDGWDDDGWDDEYWDVEFGDDGWGDEYADDGYWDDQYGDDEYWGDEYWDDEFGECLDG